MLLNSCCRQRLTAREHVYILSFQVTGGGRERECCVAQIWTPVSGFVLLFQLCSGLTVTSVIPDIDSSSRRTVSARRVSFDDQSGVRGARGGKMNKERHIDRSQIANA